MAVKRPTTNFFFFLNMFLFFSSLFFCLLRLPPNAYSHSFSDRLLVAVCYCYAPSISIISSVLVARNLGPHKNYQPSSAYYYSPYSTAASQMQLQPIPLSSLLKTPDTHHTVQGLSEIKINLFLPHIPQESNMLPRRKARHQTKDTLETNLNK